jgi:hypothetical protein
VTQITKVPVLQLAAPKNETSDSLVPKQFRLSNLLNRLARFCVAEILCAALQLLAGNPAVRLPRRELTSYIKR